MSDETIQFGTPTMADGPAAVAVSSAAPISSSAATDGASAAADGASAAADGASAAADGASAAADGASAAADGASAAADGASAAPGNPTKFIEAKLLEGKVIEVLQQIFDPEIPVNIYELGLIYVIDVQPDNSVLVKMTLTAPACPVAGTLPGEVETKVNAIPEVKEAKVELVWDPPWTREMMSESALLQLGF